MQNGWWKVVQLYYFSIHTTHPLQINLQTKNNYLCPINADIACNFRIGNHFAPCLDLFGYNWPNVWSPQDRFDENRVTRGLDLPSGYRTRALPLPLMPLRGRLLWRPRNLCLSRDDAPGPVVGMLPPEDALCTLCSPSPWLCWRKEDAAAGPSETEFAHCCSGHLFPSR